jgi:hypothetical protein
MCEDAELEVTLDRPPRGARIRRRAGAGLVVLAAAGVGFMAGAATVAARDVAVLQDALALLNKAYPTAECSRELLTSHR